MFVVIVAVMIMMGGVSGWVREDSRNNCKGSSGIREEGGWLGVRNRRYKMLIIMSSRGRSR